MLTSAACLRRPCRLAGAAHPAATADFSIQEGEISRETDCLLEEAGFEPSVPRGAIKVSRGDDRIREAVSPSLSRLRRRKHAAGLARAIASRIAGDARPPFRDPRGSRNGDGSVVRGRIGRLWGLEITFRRPTMDCVAHPAGALPWNSPWCPSSSQTPPTSSSVSRILSRPWKTFTRPVGALEQVNLLQRHCDTFLGQKDSNAAGIGRTGEVVEFHGLAPVRGVGNSQRAERCRSVCVKWGRLPLTPCRGLRL